MGIFKLPLSGDVVQSFPILPWSFGQVGLVNITVGPSPAPEVEADVLAEFGSYGRQIGRIADALAVLVAHFHQKDLSQTEKDALKSLQEMITAVAKIKKDHKRPALSLTSIPALGAPSEPT